jgi:hypothetical protein
MDKYGNTRKVTFTIDDSQYLRNELKRNNLTDKEIDEIFAMGTLSEFKGTFTLYGRGITEDRYELFNVNGEKMNVNEAIKEFKKNR